MSEFEKISLFFVSIDSLVNIYKNNENIKFENLVVITDQKIPVCQVYYPERKLVVIPYSLKVNKQNIIKWRKRIVQFMVDDMINRYQKGQRGRTITTYSQKIFNFIDWLDNNKLVLNDNIESAKNAFWQYTTFLKNKIRTGEYSNGEAHSRHSYASKLLNVIYKDDENYIASGIKIIPNKRPNKIEKSNSDNQKYQYKYYHDFFHQVTDFLIGNKPYPLKLKLVSDEVWCLPGRYTLYTKQKIFPIAFNPINGEIRKDVHSKYIKGFLKSLEKNNQYYSDRRFKLGSLALKAFYILFLTNTGMNDSTAATLEWDSDFVVDKEKQKFRNIKYRAGNKPVEFQIQSKFIKDFKKFLLLREYLLNGKNFEYLFFTGYDDKVRLNPKQKKGTFSSNINIYFSKNINPKLPRINSKQLRVDKTYQVIKSDGIVAASQLAQSSLGTIINSYLGESQESSEIQFREYFERLNQSIFDKSINDQETAIGQCKKLNNPEQDISPFLFKNKCEYKEGCLFCKHYGLHIDKTDLQKLYSLKYVINECRYIAKDENHFLSIYSNILNRIDNIEEEIINSKRLSKDILDEYKNDVFINENLHPYWDYKLKTLLNMGVLK